jgi:hypothetical protein
MTEPYKIMTPRQHYETATRMLTNNLDAIYRADPGWSAADRAVFIAEAQVHATLATVPQAQFDAWKPGRTASELSLLPSGGPACVEHGRNLTRCKACHLAYRPHTQCGACLVACWDPGREVGSRCDLPDCAGIMVAYPGDRVIREAPIEE